MSGELQLRATIEAVGPAGAVVLSDEQVAALGGGKTPAVRVTIGGVTVEARVGRMGGRNLVGFSKQRRAELGIGIGDLVDATIVLDSATRTVEVPPELAEALDAAGVRPAFDALAVSHRREHVRAVTDAKRPETRARRVAAVVSAVGG